MDRQTIENVVKACNVDTSEGPVDARLQQVVVRLVTDFYQAIEDLDLSQSEVWKGVEALIDMAKADEFALLGSAIGLEHFLDLRADEADAKAGLTGGTPRTIEGPLYVLVHLNQQVSLAWTMVLKKVKSRHLSSKVK